MGILVAHWVTRYGFALNLEGDFSPADNIRPCGLPNVRLTTVEAVPGVKPIHSKVGAAVIINFEQVFQRKVNRAWCRLELYESMNRPNGNFLRGEK